MPGSFNDVDRSKCTVVVPDGCRSTYEANPYWKEFNIVERSEYEAGVESTADDQTSASDARFYGLDGRRAGNSIEGLTKGIYIVRQNGKAEKIIRN